MNKACVYYCEGEDDQKLIDSLKVSPGKIGAQQLRGNLILRRKIVT